MRHVSIKLPIDTYVSISSTHKKGLVSFDLLLDVHGKQLMYCYPNHTFPVHG